MMTFKQWLSYSYRNPSPTLNQIPRTNTNLSEPQTPINKPNK